MYLKKKVCKEIHVLVLQGKYCVPYETMLERIVGVTFCFSNIHEVLKDINNHYRSMVMNTIRMNYDYSNEGSCIDEEPNESRFPKLLKEFIELLWDKCINYNKLLVIA